MPAAYPAEERDRIVLDVFADMEKGKSLREACRRQSISEATILRWIDQDETGEWSKQYTRARDSLLAFHADQIISIADETNDPAKARIQVDARKWVFSRLMPKRFGDKVQNEVTGPNGAALGITYVLPAKHEASEGYDSCDEV